MDQPHLVNQKGLCRWLQDAGLSKEQAEESLMCFIIIGHSREELAEMGFLKRGARRVEPRVLSSQPMLLVPKTEITNLLSTI